MYRAPRTRSEPYLAEIPRNSTAIGIPAPDQPDHVPSTVYDERANVGYEVGYMLGKGGFARCFLASADGDEFALKVVARDSIRRESHLRKLKKEIANHFTLRHPNIVALYSTFDDCRNIYMLLEYCPNGTLGELDS